MRCSTSITESVAARTWFAYAVRPSGLKMTLLGPPSDGTRPMMRPARPSTMSMKFTPRVPTQTVLLSAAKVASWACRSTDVWLTMRLSRVRMTVTVLLVTDVETMRRPSREKPRPCALTGFEYCGPSVLASRASPSASVPSTAPECGAMTVIVLLL